MSAKRYSSVESAWLTADGRWMCETVVLATDYDAVLAVLKRCVEALEAIEHTDSCDECGDKHCVVCGRQECVIHKDDCIVGAAIAAAKARLEEEARSSNRASSTSGARVAGGRPKRHTPRRRGGT